MTDPQGLDREIQKAEQALEEGRQVERWLKVSTVCRRLELHFRTVYRWIEDGRFGARGAMQLPNGHWRIKESAVQRLETHDS
jgi:excisionase family DNA binding protein